MLSDDTPGIAGLAGTNEGDQGVTVTITPVRPAGSPSSPAPATVLDGEFSFAPGQLSDGKYRATVVQTDTVGHTTTRDVSFWVDTTGPTISLTSPANLSKTGDSTPEITGTAELPTDDNHNEAEATVRIYRGTSTNITPVQSITKQIGSGGVFTVIPSALEDGKYTITAEQSDTAGPDQGDQNTSVSAANTFTVDATKPTVTLAMPTPAGTDTTPTFTGTATTGDGDVTLKIYPGSVATGTPQQTRTATPGGNGAWTVDATPLADGTYTAIASQSDTVNDPGESVPRTFRIDTTAPVVAITRPAAGARISGSTPTLAGTAGHGTGDLASVTVRIFSGSAASGTPVQTLTAPVSAAGDWTTLGSGALDDGTYAAQVTQIDDAGNTGTSAVSTFVVKVAPDAVADTTAPTAALSMPLQRVSGRIKAGYLLVDLTVDEPSNALVIAAIGVKAAKKLGLKSAPLASNPDLVQIGQGLAGNADGRVRMKIPLTAAAIKALKRAGSVTITVGAVVADLAGNRSYAATRARLVR